jgi:hypothetical protein
MTFAGEVPHPGEGYRLNLVGGEMVVAHHKDDLILSGQQYPMIYFWVCSSDGERTQDHGALRGMPRWFDQRFSLFEVVIEF